MRLTIAILLGVLAAAVIFGGVLYDIALNARAWRIMWLLFDRKKKRDDPANWGVFSSDFLARTAWKEAFVSSFDGLRLRAICIPARAGGAWAILCHGYSGRSEEMSVFAERMRRLGYGVLMPDARGHGKSQGNYAGMGWKERRDVLQWAEFLHAEYRAGRIVLFGISMGAATVLMASGEDDFPEYVAAIVADSAYTSIRDEFAHVLRHRIHLPATPVLWCMEWVTRLRAGYSLLRDGSVLSQVAKARAPVLFLHGEADTFVPFAMCDMLYRQARCPKERFTVPGAGHVMSFSVDPKGYWTTVEGFLRKYAPPEHGTISRLSSPKE